jgi:hypothetical protein
LFATESSLQTPTNRGRNLAGWTTIIGSTAGTSSSGTLFSGRYKALVVDGSGNGYLKTLCDYVHLSPDLLT